MFLWTAISFAILSIDGKTPVKKESLKISESWVEISLFKNFSFLVGILLGPIDLFGSKEDMILIISYLSVGLRKKGIVRSIFRKIRKVFMGIFNTFFSFSGNASKEVSEYVCNFNWFCTLVSLEMKILGICDGLLFRLEVDFIPFRVFLMVIVIHFTSFHRGC